ncbi:MAG: DUF1156 domain-containing protein [Candidatus Heimdallarchaeota archaeon]
MADSPPSHSIEKTIEQFFPYTLVSKLAYRESNAKRYYRPVLTLHKWFARRLGSVFRAILIYSGTNLSGQHLPGSEKDFWQAYLKEYNFSELSVLDPFMGGGTTILEAVRLGFGKVIGGDLNPVAWFTVKKSMDSVDLSILEAEFQKLSSALRDQLLEYYKTSCDVCSLDADVMYYFWIKEINCESCKAEIALFRSYIFAYDKKKSSIYVICPKCEQVFTSDAIAQIECPDCAKNFDPTEFTARRGFYQCPACNHSSRIVSANLSQKRRMRLYAIEYYCSSCMKRRYKRAGNADLLLFEKAKTEWTAMKNMLPIPSQEIPPGDKTKELHNHGINTFAEMFNERQLLSLGKLLDAILRIADENVREFFLLTFSTALEYQNLLCEYHRKNHYIYNLYRKHAYVNALNPVENNVWGARYGTGTFRNFFAKTIRIKEYCKNPYEYYITASGESKRRVMKRPIKGNVVASYRDIGRKETDSNASSVLLYCSSSQELDVPTDTIDLVITDPPYAGNVQYGELADFYYVWLRLGLKKTYPWFQPPFSPKKAEIITNITRKKTTQDFQKELSSVFNEVRRVLKPEGLMIFTFHHKKVEAWAVMTQSILENGFYIVAVYPVWSEMKTSTQIRGKSSIEFDAIFVCKQRRHEPIEISWSGLLPIIEREIEEKIAEISKLPLQRDIRKEDRLVVQFGVGLHHYSLHYPHVYLNGTLLPVETILERLAEKLI